MKPARYIAAEARYIAAEAAPYCTLLCNDRVHATGCKPSRQGQRDSRAIKPAVVFSQ
jgi:hypothetical protein